MKLNLAYPEASDISFKVSKFPDGQQSITIAPIQTPLTIQIRSRLNSFKDLELIICANKALRNNESSQRISLYVPYFLGARSDRKFEDGGINYLKDVICPLVNSQNFDSVFIVDPHSDVTEALINNFHKTSNQALVNWALRKINSENYLLVSPDAGALKKVFSVAENIEYKKDIIIASKHRGVDGKITHTDVPGFGVYDVSKDIIIIDDICDGGRTFIEIAKTINQIRTLSSVSNIHGKNYLIVTHGIFSAGFDELAKYFDGIYCTNSIQDIDNPLVKQFNVF